MFALTLVPVTAGCARTQLAARPVSTSASRLETRHAEAEVFSEDGCQHSTVRVDDSGSSSFWVPLGEPEVELGPGTVEVEGTLAGAGRRTLARHEGTADLVATNPDGAACDGDEWPHGILVLPESAAKRAR